MPDKGVKDEDLIPLLGKRRFVWITKDDRAKSEHETLLRDANISVVWIRGLSHDRKKVVAQCSALLARKTSSGC